MIALIQDTPRARRLAGYAALLLMVAIATLSLLPPAELPDIETSDKVKHFLAYTALAVPVAIRLGRGRALMALVLTAAFGALMEVGQLLAPTGRDFSVFDELANALGATLGTGIALALRRR